MPTVLRQWGSPLGTLPNDGKFLASFDHEVGGDPVLVADIQLAHKFDDAAEALEFIRRVPAGHPRRTDGKPNRPMLAWNWELVNI